MPIPVIIITGFLGTGKTSFLRQLLPLCGEAGVRPALIINEVGTVDVDGELLADLHAEQARLVGGCVCCTLQAQLATTVDDLIDRQAGDVIIIECSGMSDPLDVVNVLSTPALVSRVTVAHIICLLDASRLHKTLNTPLVQTQFKAADVLIFNKSDRLADPDEAKFAEVHTINPHAATHHVEYGDIGKIALLNLLTTPAPTRTGCTCAHDHCHHEHHHHQHALPATFCSVALPLPATMPQATLTALMNALPENVIRAKGFAHVEGEGWHVLHKVYDSVETYPHTGNTPSTGAILICIGQHLQPDEIERLTTSNQMIQA